MVRTSRHFGYGITKSQDFIHREANHLADLILKRNGQPFDLSRPLSLCMLNVTFSMLFNTTYEEGDEEFGKILDNVMVFFTWKSSSCTNWSHSYLFWTCLVSTPQ